MLPIPSQQAALMLQGTLKCLADFKQCFTPLKNTILQGACAAPVNHRLQQQGVHLHQQNGHVRTGSPLVPAQQPKTGKNGNGSSDSGSNSPDIHGAARAVPAVPEIVAA